MNKKDPEGYRKLLAYQKSCELQILTNQFVSNLPKIKTFLDLADQMSRSGRSGSKNIVEGWKRNSTKEYFTFLGFSIGAVEELKEDAADVVTGVYPGLMGLKGRMGAKGNEGEVVGEKGLIEHKSLIVSPYTPSYPLTPLVPLNPISRSELDQLRFYPLDQNLPPITQLFLRAKELNFLLYKLQKSLDLKMDNEHTKPASQRFQEVRKQEKQADDDFQKYLYSLGLRRLENGKYIDINQEQENKD